MKRKAEDSGQEGETQSKKINLENNGNNTTQTMSQPVSEETLKLFRAQLNNVRIPKAIIEADSTEKKQQLEAFNAEEPVIDSKYTDNLVQLASDHNVANKPKKCEKCDVTEGLWLNLSDGSLLCPRKNFDGSGGNNHAKEHFERTGYPLVVKLGTITPEGADVFSYPEDAFVKDPKLNEHLSHWGLNMSTSSKTEMTTAELVMAMTLQLDFDKITEKGKQLESAVGPALVGIKNLGNTCYMASVLQLAFSTPAMRERYSKRIDEIFNNAPRDPTSDFFTQLAKVGQGLLSEEHSTKEDHGKGITPRMFKTIIGKGHPEFSTGRQQDALEFFQYLLESIQRAERSISGGKFDPSTAFRFLLEERYQLPNGKVRYVSQEQKDLSLPIPVEAAINHKDVHDYKERVKANPELAKDKDAEVRPIVPFQSCLDAFLTEEIENYAGSKTATKTTRFITFPDILAFSTRRFLLDGILPKKLDVLLQVPDVLNLEGLRARGKQSGEEEIPDSEAQQSSAQAPAQDTPNPEVVAMLMSMGFPKIRCEKAALATKGQDPDAAATWLFSHMDDPDIDTPLPEPKGTAPSAAAGGKAAVNEEHVATLESMGFSRSKAVKALRSTDGNIERAMDWIFSHADDPDEPEQPAAGAGEKTEAPAQDKTKGLSDGKGEYELLGIISHIGSSTQSGHYVAHVKRTDAHGTHRWVMFDDQRVVYSDTPPLERAYLYFYQRKH